MEKYTKEGLNIYFIREERYKLANAEKASIKICISYKRKRIYYKTGIRLTMAEWKSINFTKKTELIEMRQSLENSFEKIKQYAKKLMEDGKFSFDNLKTRMNNTSGISIKETMLAKIERLDHEEAFNSADIHRRALVHFRKFGGEHLRFEDITVSWLKSYEKEYASQGKSYTTIGMYLRALRTIFNEAIEAGLIDRSLYPFGKGKYQIPTSTGRKLALSMEKIKKIKDLHVDDMTARYRDLWLFSYLCNGANFKDILQLKYGNIHANEIYFQREKTKRTSKEKKEIIAFITPEMQEIINKWGSTDRSENTYIFPYLNDAKTALKRRHLITDVILRTNKRMKKVGKDLEIPRLTTYVARHSYATILKRNGASIAFISEGLGHSDIRTTENYLGSFESDEREKNAKLLTQWN